MEDFLLMQDIVELNRQDRLRRRNDNVFMHTLSDEEFLRQFRFSKEGVTRLTELLEDHIVATRHVAHQVTPLHQVTDGTYLNYYNTSALCTIHSSSCGEFLWWAFSP